MDLHADSVGRMQSDASQGSAESLANLPSPFMAERDSLEGLSQPIDDFIEESIDEGAEASGMDTVDLERNIWRAMEVCGLTPYEPHEGAARSLI